MAMNDATLQKFFEKTRCVTVRRATGQDNGLINRLQSPSRHSDSPSIVLLVEVLEMAKRFEKLAM